MDQNGLNDNFLIYLKIAEYMHDSSYIKTNAVISAIDELYHIDNMSIKEIEPFKLLLLALKLGKEYVLVEDDYQIIINNYLGEYDSHLDFIYNRTAKAYLKGNIQTDNFKKHIDCEEKYFYRFYLSIYVFGKFYIFKRNSND